MSHPCGAFRWGSHRELTFVAGVLQQQISELTSSKRTLFFPPDSDEFAYDSIRYQPDAELDPRSR